MIEQAARAYFHVRQLRGEFDDRLQSDFEQLMKEAREYGARRNEIAHGIVMPYAMVNWETWDKPQIAQSYITGPPEYMTSRRTIPRRIRPPTEPSSAIMFGVAYAYSSKEVNTFSQQFKLLA
jgi:hypothetical protein